MLRFVSESGVRTSFGISSLVPWPHVHLRFQCHELESVVVMTWSNVDITRLMKVDCSSERAYEIWRLEVLRCLPRPNEAVSVAEARGSLNCCKSCVTPWYSVPCLYGLDLKLEVLLSSNAFAYGTRHGGTYQYPNHFVPSNHQASGRTHRWCPDRRDVELFHRQDYGHCHSKKTARAMGKLLNPS